MAGHSKFKNIQHRKGAQDKKKAKIFTKLVREIITAVRVGGEDTQSNSRLRNAVIAARAQNLPKERIDKAINQAHSDSGVDNYLEIRYEGFILSRVAIIVEALTDNKNRTASEVRAAFTKLGGSLAEPGSVSFMFDRLGIIQYDAAVATSDIILDDAIKTSVTDIVSDDVYHYIYTKIENFPVSLDFFTKKYGIPLEATIGWRPHNTIIIDDKILAEKLLKLIDILEENDDIQKVFGNYKITDSVHRLL